MVIIVAFQSFNYVLDGNSWLESEMLLLWVCYVCVVVVQVIGE